MYDDLDDEALDAKIIELRADLEKVAKGGVVVSIAGEGRRKEFTRGNQSDLRKLYDEAVLVRDRRRGGGRLRGRAIGVRFIR